MDSIKDMKCPECGHTEKFEIEIGTTLVIYNSDDEFTWKAGSDCECGDDACDFNGTVADFLGAQAATEPGQHTPGPWELKKGGHEYWYITANKGESQVALIGVMTVAPRAPEANARRIVLAVNCHDDMKRELGQTISDMRSLLSLIDAEGYAEDVDLLAIVEIANQVADRHAAAIAKAESKPAC